MSWLHRVSWKFALYVAPYVSAAIVRVPRLFSAVGKNAKKSRRRKLQMCYPETTPLPGVAVTFTRSTWGYLAPTRSPSCEGNSFIRSQSRFRSKLKLHFQKAIFTRKCSTSKQNWQLRKNFWEVAATPEGKVTTFQGEATTLLQNERKKSVIPFLCPKKIFML